MKKHQQNLKKMFQNNPPVSEGDIESYLSDNLNEEDRFRVENTILDDPFVADAIDGYRESGYNFNQNKPYADFHTFMKNVENKGAGARVVPMNARRTWVRRLAVAASLLLLVVAGWYVMGNVGQVTNDDLFAQHYSVYESDLPAFRGDVDDEITIMQTFERAMESYNQGDFAGSLPFFEEFMVSEPDSHFAAFYSGLAYLETGDADKCIERLQKAVNTKDDNYRVKSQWYTILAYLKKGDRLLAKEKLTAYVNSGATYNKEQANQLLNQL